MAEYFFPMLLALVLLPSTQHIHREKKHPPKVTPEAVEVAAPVPVVFGKKGDGLPETLKARGTITKVSLSRACGVVFWSGTLEITLRGKIKGYPHARLYVVVNCLEDMDEKKYLGKDVEVEASKLYSGYSKFRGAATFYFEAIDNTINSGGVPFYCTAIRGADILQTGGAH